MYFLQSAQLPRGSLMRENVSAKRTVMLENGKGLIASDTAPGFGAEELTMQVTPLPVRRHSALLEDVGTFLGHDQALDDNREPCAALRLRQRTHLFMTCCR